MLCPQSWQWTIRFPSAPGTESYRSWATLCHDFLYIYLSLPGNVLPVGQWLIHLCAQHLTQCLSAYLGASQPALWQRIRLPMQEMQETQVGLLGQEDPLEEEMAVHSSILAWRTPWTEEPGGLWSMGPQTVGHDWVSKCTHAHTHTHTCLFIERIFEWIIQNQLLLQTYFPQVAQLIDLSEIINCGFPRGSVGKNPLPMQETRVQSLGGEDPLEKEMAVHSSIQPGKSHGQRSLVGYSPWGHKKSRLWLSD